MKKEVIDATLNLEKIETRSALQHLFFNIYSHAKWYMKRDEPNRDVMKWFMETWSKVLSPFMPETSEKIWRKLTGKKWVYFESWPLFEYEEAPDTEAFLKSVIEDSRKVIELFSRKNGKPSRLSIYVSEEWKFDVAEKLLSGQRPDGSGKEFGQLIKQISKYKGKPLIPREVQFRVLAHAVPFLERELGVAVSVAYAENSSNEKAKMSNPYKPGLLAE